MRPELREGEDFYVGVDGKVVFTAAHHLKRGWCCGSGCRHCPWREKKSEGLVVPLSTAEALHRPLEGASGGGEKKK